MDDIGHAARQPDRPPYRSAATLTEHRDFHAAVDTLIDGMADLYGDDTRLIRSLFEYTRAVTFMLAVGVAMEHHDDQPAGRLSVATLVTAAAQMGIGPDRRVRRIVEGFRADGLIEARAMPGDARRHWLHPTERMFAIDREWLAVFHRPLVVLYPDALRFQLGERGDRDYHRIYRRLGQTTLAEAHAVMTANPDVDFFLHQTSGGRILAVLLQVARDGDDDGWTPAGFYGAAARRCATTRVHVRTMMRAAADAGLVEIIDVSDLRVRPSERLRTAFARWAADALSAVDLVATLTIRQYPVATA